MQLVVDDIDVDRGEDRIISGLTFSVSSGEALVVTGENGSGKSTLLRALADLLPLTGGRIDLTDVPEDLAALDRREIVHHLGHENALKPAVSLGDNLRFWRDLAREPHMGVAEALELVDLDGLEAVPFGHLSTGQRRRAAIARLLVEWRPIWLLDEPTAGLDAPSERQFTEVLRGFLGDDGMIVAATHVPLDLPATKRLHLAEGTVAT